MSFSVSARGRGLRVLLGRRRAACSPSRRTSPGRASCGWWPTTCASTARRAPCSPTPSDERSLGAFLDDEGFSPLVRRAPARAPGRRRVVGRPRADVVLPGALPRRSSSPTTGCSRSPGARTGRRSRAARRATSRRSPPPSPTASACARPIAAVTRHPTHVDVVRRRRGRRGVRRGRASPRTPTRRWRCSTDPSAAEAEILGAFPYQPNEAVLHTDRALLPRRRAAWAAWNYHLLAEPRGRCAVTYYMNHLQSLDADRPFCVTLNRTAAIDARARHPRHPLRAPGLHARGDGRAAPPRGDQRRVSARTTAAPTGAGASTRTAWPARTRRWRAMRERVPA